MVRRIALCCVLWLAGHAIACTREHVGNSDASRCPLEVLPETALEVGVLASTVHQGGLVLLDSDFTLRYNALSDPPGPVAALNPLNPERAWDVAIASTGDDVALASVSDEGLDL